MKKKVVVLGATGSIGKNAALELAALSDRFEVVGLAARNNIDELVRQAEIFRPRQVLTTDTARLDELSRKLPAGVQALAGESALIDMVTELAEAVEAQDTDLAEIVDELSELRDYAEELDEDRGDVEDYLDAELEDEDYDDEDEDDDDFDWLDEEDDEEIDGDYFEIVCPSCGAYCDSSAYACKNCGTVLNGHSGGSYNSNPYNNNPRPGMMRPKSRVIAGVLALIVGSFGIHNFYLGYTNKAVAQLILAVLSCGLVSGVWAFVEAILIFAGTINTDANGIYLE